MLISNVSFPKILEEEIGSGKKSSELMIPYIQKSAKQLEKAGADFIVLPCNTLHSLLPLLKDNSGLEFTDIIEEVTHKIRKEKLRSVGVISTTKTKEDRLYNKLLGDVNVIYPNEEEQTRISEIIVRIIRNSSTKGDKIFLDNLSKRLIERGAEKVILACTDLANIAEINDKTIDSTQILIDAVKERLWNISN